MVRVIAVILFLAGVLHATYRVGHRNGFADGVSAEQSSLIGKMVLATENPGKPVKVSFTPSLQVNLPLLYDQEGKKRYICAEVQRWGSAATGFETSGFVESNWTDPVRDMEGNTLAVVDYRIPGR